MDVRAAACFAKTRAGAQSQGNTVGFADYAIAAIAIAIAIALALAQGFAVATRNTRDFLGCGVDLIDPWAFE